MPANLPEKRPSATRESANLPSTGFHPLTPPAPQLAPSIPDHELLRRIGSGSYGEVWLARTILGEPRAVKVVYRHSFEDDRPFQREFEGIQKFEPISRSHPSQLAILHVGRNEADDYFYYVMELADDAAERSDGVTESWRDGQTPAAQLPNTPSLHDPSSYAPRTLKLELKHRTRLPPTECVSIALALAEALTHLHKHGLVHRDIKPSNIIFVGGMPKLADIGLVTDVDASRSFVGTEGYLPPEGPGTPQADNYSLGKVLYELCTGKDRKDYPALPPDLRERPGSEQRALLELNAVLVKACATDLRERYQSAEEMHADLVVLQRGESVKAKRSTKRRIILFSRIGMIGALLGLLLAGGWFVSTNVSWRKPGSTERKVTLAQQQEARRLYSRALTYPKSTMAGLNRRFELLNAAINEDPNFAQAHAELAQTYLESTEALLPPKHAVTEARKNALRALELDDSLPLAHTALAGVLAYDDWNGAKAEAEYKLAIAADPRFALAYGNYANLLIERGRLDDAEQVLKQADQIEPKAQIILANWCWRYYVGHQFEDQLQQATRLLDLYPDNTVGLMHLAFAQERLGRLDEALATAQRMKQLDPAPDFVAFLGFVHGRMGHQGEARQAMEELRVMSSSRRVSGTYPAQVLLGLGDKDGAIEYLQRAVDEYPATVLGLKANPLWDEVRDDPRFTALLKKVGLEN